MENQVDIREIAEYRMKEFEQKINSSSHSGGYSILYVVTTEEGEVRVSKTPHILAGKDHCYLIHTWKHCPCSNWYNTYEVESINVYGEVGAGDFDEEYSFSISDAGFNRCEEIRLKRNGREIYSESLWEYGTFSLTKRLAYVWELYRKCKNECTTLYESQLLCKMAVREKTIKELEGKLSDSTLKEQYLQSEISQYKGLLDDIRSAQKAD